MEAISVKDRLPENRTYVLAHYTGGNWGDSEDQAGVEWKVVKFTRGLSQKDREALLESNPRERYYTGADEHFNNKRPYYWDEFGPGEFLRSRG